MIPVWFGAVVVGLASLMVNHVFSLPLPDDERRLLAEVENLRESSQPFALHVIYENCSCTGPLFDHLLARGLRAGWKETIALVGAPESRHAAARSRGFSTYSYSPHKLRERLGVEAAPVLIVLDREGTLRYAGGYFETPATVRPRDARLLDGVSARQRLSPLPVYGCAVSPSLQAQTDLLGLRYSARDD